MDRRKIIKAGASVLFMTVANSSMGQSMMPNLSKESLERLASDMPMPFKQVRKYSDDSNRVVSFFSFDCPFCFEYHNKLSQWGSALPLDWGFEFLPVVVNNVESYIITLIFFTLKRSQPEKIDDFMKAAYHAFHREAFNVKAETAWQRLLESVGVDMNRFGEAYLKTQEDEEYVFDEVIKRQVSYGVVSTPTVVVGGEYVATPDGTQGNEDLFMQLLTGLVSKSAQSY